MSFSLSSYIYNSIYLSNFVVCYSASLYFSFLLNSWKWYLVNIYMCIYSIPKNNQCRQYSWILFPEQIERIYFLFTFLTITYYYDHYLLIISHIFYFKHLFFVQKQLSHYSLEENALLEKTKVLLKKKKTLLVHKEETKNETWEATFYSFIF